MGEAASIVLEDDVVSEDLRLLKDIVGEKAVKKIISLFGGNNVYIPKAEFFQRHSRNKSICRDFDSGASVRALSVKYNLSGRQVQTIIDSRGGKIKK